MVVKKENREEKTVKIKFRLISDSYFQFCDKRL